MAGISPKLPLSINKTDVGYDLNKNLKQSIHQNFKHLLLTSPGEKVFDPNFGVGLKRFLFEQSSEQFESDVISRINQQVSRYMSFLQIKKITVKRSPDYNRASLSIEYGVASLSISNILSLDIASNN